MGKDNKGEKHTSFKIISTYFAACTILDGTNEAVVKKSGNASNMAATIHFKCIIKLNY